MAAFLERVSCRFAAHVIVANDGIRAAVVARGLRENRVTSVYNSGETTETTTSPEDLRRLFDLPSRRLIVHAGGVNSERDLETLIRAVASVADQVDADLVIAGDAEPNYRTTLFKLASDLRLQTRMHFVGPVSLAQAHALMALSDVGIVTLEANPLTHLAWPIRVMEYANLRKPLVVPKLRFLHEMLGDAAQYYRPGDPESLARAIVSILRSPESRQGAITKAAEVCRRFEWARMRGTLLKIYRGFEGPNAG